MGIVKGALEKAAQCYKRSYIFWSKLHGKHGPLLIPILCDMCILQIFCNSKEAPGILKRINQLNKQAAKAQANHKWLYAYSIYRVMSVATGQNGSELRIALKDSQEKVTFDASHIKIMYATSVNWMKENSAKSTEEHVIAATNTALSNYKNWLKTTTTTTEKTTTTTTTTETTTTTKTTTTTETTTEQQELDQSLSKKL